jgi:hypothetical protein
LIPIFKDPVEPFIGDWLSGLEADRVYYGLHHIRTEVDDAAVNQLVELAHVPVEFSFPICLENNHQKDRKAQPSCGLVHYKQKQLLIN